MFLPSRNARKKKSYGSSGSRASTKWNHSGSKHGTTTLSIYALLNLKILLVEPLEGVEALFNFFGKSRIS